MKKSHFSVYTSALIMLIALFFAGGAYADAGCRIETGDLGIQFVRCYDNSGKKIYETYSWSGATVSSDGKSVTGGGNWSLNYNTQNSQITLNNGTYATDTYTFDSSGNKIGYSLVVPSQNTNTIESYTYQNGKMVGSVVSTADPSGSGNRKIVTTNYNSDGSYIGSSTTYTNGSGGALTGTWKDGNTTYNINNGIVTSLDYRSSCYRSGPTYNCQYGGYTKTYDADGKNIVSTTYVDLNGNQKVVASNGQTTYLDKDGNPLTGKFTDGRIVYNFKDGVENGYSSGSYGDITEYDAAGRQIGYIRCSGYAQNGNSCSEIANVTAYGYDENGRLVGRSFTQRNGTGYDLIYEYDENGHQSGSYQCSKNTVGNYTFCSLYIGEQQLNCSVLNGLCVATTDYGMDGILSFAIDPSSLAIVAKTICADGKSDCKTEVCDVEGNVVGQYADYQPVSAWDYDRDGTALVYDDQCFVKTKIDSDGNELYDFGDTLLSSMRKTQYTPSEASEIIGNSDGNMIVMYFK